MARAPAVCAVILGAGTGRRAGEPKQFARAGGRWLLAHACAPFAACEEVDALVVVVPGRDCDRAQEELKELALPKLLGVVAGGATRHLSSRQGLQALPPSCRIVLIHDAARPFASTALIRRVVRSARRHGAVIPAVAVADSTIELAGTALDPALDTLDSDEPGVIGRYLARDRLRAVQTPQGFDRTILEAAFDRARASGATDATDDAALVVATGAAVVVVEGERTNVKITTAAELAAAIERLERDA